MQFLIDLAPILGYIVMVMGAILLICLAVIGVSIIFVKAADFYLSVTHTREEFVEFVREKRRREHHSTGNIIDSE